MSEQITYYHDAQKMSPFCHRVEVALLETGASYSSSGFDIRNKPAWFAQVNPMTGKVPAITYGGPNVPPEQPSPHSFKLTESLVILEFLADLFPNSGLLPPTSDPTARARVRFFIDVVVRDIEAPMFEIHRKVPGATEKLLRGLERVQGLLPDPDAPNGGEYAIGKNFTIADCTIVPLVANMIIAARTNIGSQEPGTGEQLKEVLEGDKFARWRRYQRALWEKESVRKAVDLERMEGVWRAWFA